MLLFLALPPQSGAGFIFKPHYPDAGLRLSWYVDTLSQPCNGRLDERQAKILRKALRGGQRGMVQAWAGTYEDVVGRPTRVGDADIRAALVLGSDGSVSGVTVLKSSTDNRQLPEDVKRRLGSLRLRRLRLDSCATIELQCRFRLDLSTS